MGAIKHYVLIDPFNSVTSGVTTYVQSVSEFLGRQGVKTGIIARYKNEKLPEFRRRIAKEISKIPKLGLLVEAPESLHSTSDVGDDVSIHIRLHGSRQFGNWLQGQPINKVELAAEQREIARAQLVSAPSHAAVEASRHLFRYPEQVSCYPNPLPVLEGNSSENNIDLLFLGRWQPLKGIAFFENVARLMPGCRIAVACTVRPPELPAGVSYIPIRTLSDRYSALTSSRIILVPSLFETASMVGLEALVAGRQVVTWAHLGLAEYADEPYLYRAQPWCIDSLIGALKKAMSESQRPPSTVCTDRIHTGFSDTLNRLLLKGNLDISTMPVPVSITDWDGVFTSIIKQEMSANKFYFLRRKLRKLIRDPAAFWRDSSLFRLLNKNKMRNPPSGLPLTALSEPLATTAVSLAAPQETASASVILEKIAAPAALAAPAAPLPALLGKLSWQGKINLKDAVEKPKGWITTLVHTDAGTAEVFSLRTALNKFTDFAPFRETSLSHILTEIDPEEPVMSILNRIDVKNKERLARIDNIVLINVSANVLQAMRCCGPSNRIILVLTEMVPTDLSLIAASTDAVICLASHPAATLEWRRKNIIENQEQLPNMLRKVVQEIGPKDPDMLLPLIGGTVYDPALTAFDARRYQGIIRLAPGSVPRVASLRDYIAHMAGDVREMLVLDSVYMRYRSLCEAVEAGNSPASLIEACLQDGVLFDVH